MTLVAAIALLITFMVEYVVGDAQHRKMVHEVNELFLKIQKDISELGELYQSTNKRICEIENRLKADEKDA